MIGTLVISWIVAFPSVAAPTAADSAASFRRVDSEILMLTDTEPGELSEFRFSALGRVFCYSDSGLPEPTGCVPVPVEIESKFAFGRGYFGTFGDDVILVFEVHNFESGGIGVVRFDSRALEVRWRIHIPAFNLGEPGVEGRALYLSGVGFIGKLDLETGGFQWKHEDLLGKANAFVCFGPPRIGPDLVVFVGECDPGKKVEIAFEKISGQVKK